MQIVPEAEEELGYVDSIFGRGTWTRVTDGVFKYANENPFFQPTGFSCDVCILMTCSLPRCRWAENRVRSSPECVERFVCETYRTGENLDGVGYILLKVAK